MPEIEISACSLAARREKLKKEAINNGYDKEGWFKKSGERASNGAFERQSAIFNKKFGYEKDELKPEKGRYRLIWAAICPWATRQVITLKLLGIGEDIVSIGKVNPLKTDKGWEFSLDKDSKDPVLGFSTVPEAYYFTDPGYQLRPTVPFVADTITKKIVNNDFKNLTKEWILGFKEYHKSGAPDLYPLELREEIDKLNDWLYDRVNNGVYKAGFAANQEQYEKNYKLVFESLDILEERLSKNRFLFGDYITDSDVRLYVTLARFDVAYYFGFRLNYKRLRDYPNLWNYTKELYSIKAFNESTDFDAIKRGYLLLDNGENPFKILPLGPDTEAFSEPNNREELFGPIKFNY